MTLPNDKVFPSPRSPLSNLSHLTREMNKMLWEQGRSSTHALNLDLITGDHYIQKLPSLPLYNLINYTFQRPPLHNNFSLLISDFNAQSRHARERPIGEPTLIEISSDEEQQRSTNSNSYGQGPRALQEAGEQKRQEEGEENRQDGTAPKNEERKQGQNNSNGGTSLANTKQSQTAPLQAAPTTSSQQNSVQPSNITKNTRKTNNPKRKQPKKQKITRPKTARPAPARNQGPTLRKRKPVAKANTTQRKRKQKQPIFEAPAIQIGPRHQAVIPPFENRGDIAALLASKRDQLLLRLISNPKQ